MGELNDSVPLRNKLLDFIAEPNPLLCMLKWITARLMQIEAETKIGAKKGKHIESALCDEVNNPLKQVFS